MTTPTPVARVVEPISHTKQIVLNDISTDSAVFAAYNEDKNLLVEYFGSAVIEWYLARHIVLVVDDKEHLAEIRVGTGEDALLLELQFVGESEYCGRTIIGTYNPEEQTLSIVKWDINITSMRCTVPYRGAPQNDLPMTDIFTVLGTKFNAFQQMVFDQNTSTELSQELATKVEAELNSCLTIWAQDEMLAGVINGREMKFTAFIEENSLKLKGTPALDEVLAYVAEQIAYEQQTIEELTKPEKHRIEQVQPNPGISATTELLNGLPNTMVAVNRSGVGDGFVAYIVKISHANTIPELLDDSEDNYKSIDEGLFSASWFPVGYGESPLEAALVLEERCVDILRNVEGRRDDYKYVLNSILNNWVLDTVVNHYYGADFELNEWLDFDSGKLMEYVERHCWHRGTTERSSILITFTNGSRTVRAPISVRYREEAEDKEHQCSQSLITVIMASEKESIMGDSALIETYRKHIVDAINGTDGSFMIDDKVTVTVARYSEEEMKNYMGS